MIDIGDFASTSGMAKIKYISDMQV